jgi:20S proteasome alpha/beta subunit
MSNFSFRSIDVPAAAGTYAYISVDGVDAAGEAVGNYGNVDGEGDGTFHGLVATTADGTRNDPGGSSNTDIVGITPGGEIFGDYVDSANRQHGFVENNGGVTNVDVFLANSTTVDGVNDAGVIYGEFADNTNTVHGFIDNNGSFTQIDVPGSTSTSVSGVNAAGTIVGTFTDAEFAVHGFVESNGSFKTVDPPGSIFTSVVGVSDAGVIVGNYQDSANNQHGFVDNNGVFTTISIAGATSIGVSAINAAGEIVGYYADGGGNIHGFVDQSGVITTVDIPGATQTDILGISAAGEISGYYNDSHGNQHGFVGTPASTVIESFGSTSLVQVGSNYYLDNNSTGIGPELQYGGAPVVTGEFVVPGVGTWTMIGVEQTSTGYEVAGNIPGTNEYSVWSTDSNGNYTGNYFLPGSGTSSALESLETSFHQDLNGDGVIGVTSTDVIESLGSTSLIQVGSNYYLDNNTTGIGPELKFGGAPVVTGEFVTNSGTWTMIAVEQTSTGYEVAGNIPGTNEYSVWSTDSNGNYTGNYFLPGSGTSSALESLETSFHQDLNGDGVIGVTPTDMIESFGSTSLVQVGNNYYLDSNSTGIGPELEFGGAPVVTGEFVTSSGTWTMIGVEQTSTGYEVAGNIPGTNEYSVWSTDSNGNYTGNYFLPGSGNSSALESLETSFHQDLNGDGVIGVAPTDVIESAGSTSLVQVGNNYYLDNNSTGIGPELKYGGAPVVTGEFVTSAGTWTMIGAEQTSTGYEVAGNIPGTDEYSVWSTDSSGNYTGNYFMPGPGNSSALESLETSFDQDLNGDGTIGAPAASDTFSLQYKGFDYVAFYNGAYENSDSLPSLAQTGANSIEATLDYGIDAATSQVVADPNYTDSLAALGNTISQAEKLGLSVMVRPLIDFLNPAEVAPYSVGEWRQDYQPTNVAAFFASYQQMIVQEAEVAQANGAQMLSIGAELDQLTGPQYLSYWTDIINAVRQVFTGALTYSASWNTASEVSFWSQLNYEGIDNYVPLSNAANPTLQDLVNGWLNPATEATNPGAYAVIGNQSPVEYFENLSAQSGKPLLFTELGYANDSGAAADPSASGNSPDPTLQADLYQAFFQAWTQSHSSALVGTYFWEWDPNGSSSNVGPNIDSFSPQNSPALAQATAGFEAVSVPAGAHLVLTDATAGASATIGAGATLELVGAESGAVTFGGPTGTLVLDHASTFTGQIFNLTGNGSPSGSDQIDLKDIAFGPGTTVSYAGTSSGGLLTVSDDQNHTASISLAGNYTASTFSLSADGSGGTVVIDPPVKHDLASGTLSFGNADSADQSVTQSYAVAVATGAATQLVSVTIAAPGNDAFVFHSGIGSDTIVNATSADTIELDGFSAVANSNQLASLLNAAQTGQPQSLFHSVNGGHDTVIDLGNHDSITLTGVQIADLHAGNFIIH